MRTFETMAVNQRLAELQKERVREMMQGEKTRDQALELAFQVLASADHLVSRFEAENALPQPIVCQLGCHFCCFNQIELTPPEAFLMGDYLDRQFSPQEKNQLRDNLTATLKRKSGQSKTEIARRRMDFPCPLLRDGRCAVYPVRPLVCRAMHSFDAARCEKELRSGDLAPTEFYAHRYEIILSLGAGLLDGCRALGCQAGSLDLAGALLDFFTQTRVVERWLAGEQVFGAAGGDGGPVEQNGKKWLGVTPKHAL